MEREKLCTLIEEFYGSKCNLSTYYSEKYDIFAILYESFCLVCGVDDQGKNFYAGIETGNDGLITRFLGKTCSKETDEESIRESLQLIDDYCRLRLPDKFLETYDQKYMLSSCEK